MDRTRQLIRTLLVGALVASLLAVVSVAYSGTLHRWLHGDADQPSHECGITVYLDGALDSAMEAAIAAPLPAVAAAREVFVREGLFRPSPCVFGAGGRAPPSAPVLA